MRWQDVLADKSLQDLPYKIELNQYGKIEMSPTSVLHSSLKGYLAGLLAEQLGNKTFTNLPIVIGKTKKVKVANVAWGTTEYH